MVSDGNTLLVCGTKPTPGRTRSSAVASVMSSPLSMTVPERIVTRPKSALSSVDLPAPLGPMMPTSSPVVAVQVGAVEDVDPGHVAGDEVVGAQHGSVGVVQMGLACLGVLGGDRVRLGRPAARSLRRRRSARRGSRQPWVGSSSAVGDGDSPPASSSFSASAKMRSSSSSSAPCRGARRGRRRSPAGRRSRRPAGPRR